MDKVDLTPAKLAELRQKAEACDPKIWEIDKYGNVVSVAHTVAECGFVATCGSDEDTQFIAAADPATVLAMVEEIERLRIIETYYINGEIKQLESEAGQ